MFFTTVSRHHAAVSRTNVPHRRGVDASRHACTTPVLFEKAHETRCFPRSPCWRTRTVRNAATHVEDVVGLSAKVYGDCRSASAERRISGALQARLRNTAQTRQPSPPPNTNRHNP